jgi:hypothetical protein
MNAPDARISFADALVACGVAGAVLAPVNEPLHADNRLLASALVRALGTGCSGLDEILGCVRSAGAPISGYAVIGDPALRAVAAPDAATLGARVFAPHPDHQLVSQVGTRPATLEWE